MGGHANYPGQCPLVNVEATKAAHDSEHEFNVRSSFYSSLFASSQVVVNSALMEGGFTGALFGQHSLWPETGSFIQSSRLRDSDSPFC